MRRIAMTLVMCAVLLPGAWAGAADYVGSEQCFECHQDQYNYWQASGHPWKLRKMVEVRSAKLPLPPGYRWQDISYVIGGAIKKARFIDLEGYIITTAKDGSEAKTQYNINDGSWSFYHKGEKKPYKCGPCHMTAYNPKGNQDGLPGMIGTWAEDGIGCEECHGAGSDHTIEPAKTNIKIDRTAEACGHCHNRGGLEGPPPASKGFIRHHEQFNELKTGPHGDLECVECHDPHKRAILVEDKCAECHEEAAKSFADTIHGKTGLACMECHMPKVTKSAISVATYTGDVRTHLFNINTDPKADMFTVVEEKGKKSTFAKNFVTVDYVCLGCHASRDRAWAGEHAKGLHK